MINRANATLYNHNSYSERLRSRGELFARRIKRNACLRQSNALFDTQKAKRLTHLIGSISPSRGGG